MMLPSLDQIHDAQNLIYRYMPPTPQYTWPLINARVPGTEIWIKHENHTPLGAFKIRSSLVYAHWLKQTQPALQGIVAATRGNFGQGAGFAARLLGLKAVIVVPHGNSVEKNQAMRAQGAELIEHGDDFQESLEFARTLAAERGFAMFESFHSTLMLGAATYALEFLHAVTNLDIVYVPIGMGSSICGMAAARHALNLSFEIVGVTSDVCRGTALSFSQHQIVESPARTQIADGVACRKPSPGAMEIIWEHVARIVEVPDPEIAQAMTIYYQDTHNLAEGAGALSLATALREKAQNQGKKVGVILTGGNVDRDLFLTVLSGQALHA